MDKKNSYPNNSGKLKLGVLESVSVTRGLVNLPFNTRVPELGLDVKFSIVELSSLMHMTFSVGDKVRFCPLPTIFGSADGVVSQVLKDYIKVTFQNGCSYLVKPETLEILKKTTEDLGELKVGCKVKIKISGVVARVLNIEEDFVEIGIKGVNKTYKYKRDKLQVLDN